MNSGLNGNLSGRRGKAGSAINANKPLENGGMMPLPVQKRRSDNTAINANAYLNLVKWLY